MEIKSNQSKNTGAHADGLALLKALADGTRMAMVRALIQRPMCVEELATATGLSAGTISFHLRKLEQVRLVTKSRSQYYVLYELAAGLLDQSLRSLVQAGPDDGQQRRLRRRREQVRRTFFSRGRLVQLPRQWKKRLVVLEEIAADFEAGRDYDETEVNTRISRRFEDYCTIRRLLIDEGKMTRSGRTYRLVGPSTPKQEGVMEERSELKRQYKETPHQAGVFAVRNTAEGKVLLGSSLNLHGPLNKHRFVLEIGSHRNAALQADWNRLGPSAFVFEVLEVVDPQDDPEASAEDLLSILEKKWTEKLEPFSERGYNTGKKIRE
ncbi:MAG: metalloregulator ArsR/SmtB family transcription factor [Myxococcota bacterium]|nr:metalloregulator ArsR/SmtB family transcription factor [Myxococcota bacterium]